MPRELVWEKRLSKTDAQRQTGNQTGDIRLTQARFIYQGKTINQTTYFREIVFGECEWNESYSKKGIKREYTFREVTTAKFQIVLDNGRKWNLYLDISHKPSGEAKQGNYTTGIRWGPRMMDFLELESDLTGYKLELFKLGPNEFEMQIFEV